MREARWARSHARGPGAAVSKSMTATGTRSRKTRLWGAKSLWQTTSAGSRGGRRQPWAGGGGKPGGAAGERGGGCQHGVVPDPFGQRIARHLARDEGEDLAPLRIAAERLRGRVEAAAADVAQQRVDRVRPRAGRTAHGRADPLRAGEPGAGQPPLPFPLPASLTGPRRKIGPGLVGLPFASRVTRISRKSAIEALSWPRASRRPCWS